MRGRTNKADTTTFGSDSFLDIVANIVGILIILIVMVGVRVKNAPRRPAPVADVESYETRRQKAFAEFEKKEQARLEAWQQQTKKIEEENSRRRLAYEQRLLDRDQELERRRQMLKKRKAEQAAEDRKLARRQKEVAQRVALIEKLKTDSTVIEKENERLKQTLKTATVRLREKNEARRKLQLAVARRTGTLDELNQTLDQEKRVLQDQSSRFQDVRDDVNSLRDEIASIKDKPAKVQEWIHYPTSVSRAVRQEQVLFRCLNHRVAYTHLDDLMIRLEHKIDLAKAMSSPLITGWVGPESGFKLRYTLMRTTRSLSSQLGSPYQVGVKMIGWELHGESDDLGETEAEALREGSKFLTTLATMPARKYTVTLFVYPDSFAMAKALETALQKKGYTVSLWPWYHGRPITASIDGQSSLAK